jgi:predicted transposase/invertase (TIGR01784 family)
MLDKESYSHDLKDFSFTFIELPKFKITDINLLTNIVEKWCFFFKNADKTSEADLRKLIGSDNVIERAYEELNQFNWTEDELLTYEQETKRIMDNQAAEDYKINQIKQQIVKAEEKGKAEENIRVKIEIAKAMLLDGDSAEKIAKITGLSITEVEKYRFFDIKEK